MSRGRALIKYLIIRLSLAPMMLWLIVSMVFLLLRIAPGDPVDAILGTRADELARLALREKLGLNKSLFNQYILYLNNLFHFNLGEALNNQEPVNQIIAKALPATLELGIISLLIASIIGFIIGFNGARNPNSSTDLLGRLYGIGTYALPPFWAAMIIQLFFSVILGWLPVGGRFPPSQIAPVGTGFLILDSIKNGDLIALQGAIRHLILPAGTLGILLSGIFSRSLRLNLGESLKSDYIDAARTRGIQENNILFSHALPNSLLPVLTITGLTIASLIGGALLIEITFSWPGIAFGLKQAISQRDYPVVQGIVVVISALVVCVNLIIDLLIALIDPRVKY